MTSSNTEVIPAETSATSAEAADVSSAKAADVATTKTTDATSAEATDVTSAKAAHVAATKATTVSAATATATAGLRARGSKAADDQHTCQNRYQSSSHDLSPLGWADVPPQDLRQMSACLS
jgi:hypothetical protein